MTQPCSPPGRSTLVHNDDVAWDAFDTVGYLTDNYASLHHLDRRIIESLSPYYRALPPQGLASSLDVGTGPNVYPLMLVAAASRRLEALDHSASNVAYLRALTERGDDPLWRPFWWLCCEHNPALSFRLGDVLRRLTVRQGSAFDLPSERYDLVSMFFVAESVTGDRAEFEQLCASFVQAARPGGHLVATFMAGMPAYELGGQVLPSLPIDEAVLEQVLRPLTDDLRVWRLPPDPTLPYEYDGVLLLTARSPSRRSG